MARPSMTTEPSSGASASCSLGHRPQQGPTRGTLTARPPEGPAWLSPDLGRGHGGHILRQTRDLGPRTGLRVSPETQPGTPSGPSSSTCPGTRWGRRAGAVEAPGAPPSPSTLCRKGALLGALGALLRPASSGEPGHRCWGGVGGDGGPQDPAARLFPAVCLSGCPIPRAWSTQDRGPPTLASPWPPGGILKVPAAQALTQGSAGALPRGLVRVPRVPGLRTTPFSVLRSF